MKITIRKVAHGLRSIQGLVMWIAATAALQCAALILGAGLGLTICGGFTVSFLIWLGLAAAIGRFMPLTLEEEREKYRRLYGHRAPYSGLFNVSSDSDDDSDGQEE